MIPAPRKLGPCDGVLDRRRELPVDDSLPDVAAEQAAERRVRSGLAEPELIGYSSDEGTHGVRLIAMTAPMGAFR